MSAKLTPSRIGTLIAGTFTPEEDQGRALIRFFFLAPPGATPGDH